jgi:hypothetical protein
MYKLVKSPTTGNISCVQKQVGNVLYSTPFDPANTDYQNFKKEILADEAQLEDADGNVMSPEAAKAYVATLP